MNFRLFRKLMFLAKKQFYEHSSMNILKKPHISSVGDKFIAQVLQAKRKVFDQQFDQPI